MLHEGKGWAAHGLFAVLLAGSIAVRGQAGQSPLDDASLLERGVMSVADSQGLKLREYRRRSGAESLPRVLVFEAPSCSQPVQVSPILWTFEDESFLGSDPEQGYTRRYIYFDRSWDAPRPRAVFIQRMKYRALAMFGLTGYAPSPYLIVVESPKRCPALETADWSGAWNHLYFDSRAAPRIGSPERE
jgi:hypothetical protein